MKYEYGAMSSRYEVEADDKLTAYATMVYHYDRSAHLIALYAPEESKKDCWMSFTGEISVRLDEIFGGEGAFDKYVTENLEAVKTCINTIKRLV
ncbi:MAG: hypothetical protein EOP56_09255 [Sphingobacteriales bacterium]|nr:MAG: hypothetical protein EOP56_09255 [Sphingobacteriales bacterium]